MPRSIELPFAAAIQKFPAGWKTHERTQEFKKDNKNSLRTAIVNVPSTNWKIESPETFRSSFPPFYPLLADKLSSPHSCPRKTNLKDRSNCLIFPWSRQNRGRRTTILIIGDMISVANECHFFLVVCSP